ncbi:MAG: hypothetical protein Q7Q73_03340 [Verrucomicrobiota bacterium JB024]|nr:hypothetical protein [Verrucomicrobiota bacterium JB024]
MNDSDKSTPTEVSGYWSQLRKSEWISSEDFPTADTVVVKTIQNVVKFPSVTWQHGRTENDVPALVLGESGHRLLHINSTIRRRLIADFGARIGDAIGQQVELYLEQNVRRPDGSRGPAVRVRRAAATKGGEA